MTLRREPQVIVDVPDPPLCIPRYFRGSTGELGNTTCAKHKWRTGEQVRKLPPRNSALQPLAAIPSPVQTLQETRLRCPSRGSAPQRLTPFSCAFLCAVFMASARVIPPDPGPGPAGLRRRCTHPASQRCPPPLPHARGRRAAGTSSRASWGWVGPLAAASIHAEIARQDPQVAERAPFGIWHHSSFWRHSAFGAIRHLAPFGIWRLSAFGAIRHLAPFGIWRLSATA